jgi:putative methionine-R-sulfoxide reductase with GAF domain
MNDFLEGIRETVSGKDDRVRTARLVAALIKTSSLGRYRWVGIYDVTAEQVSIIAWSGPGAPAYPTFAPTQGLTSDAIRQKSPVLANDVTVDARYLTAFGSTRSEIIVPVLNKNTKAVVGTIDVESEQTNGFTAEDQELLEKCTCAAQPLWI